VRREHAARLGWIAPALVALVTFVAFLPALRAGFVTWDDNRNFLDNPAYRGLGSAQLRWMWTTFHMGHYVPLTWMTLGLDYELWGMNAAGYHLQNVLLHCVNAVLVYVLARRLLSLTGSGDDSSAVLSAAAAALLFAIHPLRVESVAWITERRDMLSLLFCLSSVLCYLAYARDDSRRRYLASLALFACALLSKATAISLPAVLLVLDVYPLRRLGAGVGFKSPAARRVYRELSPFALLSLGAAALSIVALAPPAQLPVGAKLAVSAYGVAFYLWKTVAPAGLAPLYEMPKHVNPIAVRYVVACVVALVVCGIAWAVRRRWPGATAGWTIFVIMLLPLLGVVQNGPQIVADRYTYHAGPALAILAGAALGRWRAPLLARTAAVAVLVAGLAVSTWRQTGVWHDSERLWARVLSVDSTSSIAQIAMGDLLAAENRVEEAADHYARGVALDPTFAIGFNNLGVVLAKQGKLTEATERYAQALAIRPSYSDAHNNWGIALSQQGDYAGAVEHFQRSIAIDSANVDAEVNLGNALVRQQRPADAVAHYARAASLRPDDAAAYLNWGVALAQLGQLPDAIARFRQALAIEPENADARTYLERAERLQSPPPR
jgi:tetratricopeptide (TPR) repeat protein